MQEAVFIKKLTLGEQATNCYVIWTAQTREGFVIDPADAGDEISQVILDERIDLRGIILTHGHFDHALALLELELNFPSPAYLHPADQFLLARARSTAHHFLGRTVDPVPTETEPLHDGQTLPFGQSALKVLHTPGHTPGSVCLSLESQNEQVYIDAINYSEHTVLFTGDTLFESGIEPLSHSYSRPLDMSATLAKLSHLEEKTFILPGHGDGAPLHDALNFQKKPPSFE